MVTPLLRWSTAIVASVGGLFGVGLTAGRLIDDAVIVTEHADRGVQLTLTTAPRPDSTPYGLPVAAVSRAGWSNTHAFYPATDIFVGCGAAIVSPVHGTVVEVHRVDAYDPAVDDPATRGGKSVAILGFDGVRYYLAHFDAIVDDLVVGDEVALGDVLGPMGDTGRTSACHLHFSISPPCPGKEWSIRRGVIWPYEYLDAWRAGEQRSPAAEVARWLADHPTACADAMADPVAGDA